MAFERGKPSTPRPAGSKVPPPTAKSVLPARNPGDTMIRESSSRTQVSLKAIREELGEFELEIMWRDERLAEFELELQEARKALEQERGKSRSPDGAAAERLREARQQLEQHMNLVQQRDEKIQALTQKGRELLARVQSLTSERTKSQQALAEMVKQIQEQQRRAQTLEDKLLTHQQREGLDPSATTPSEPPHGLGAKWRSLRAPAKLGIVAAIIAVVGGSVTLAAKALLQVEPRYTVAAQLVVPSEQVESVTRMLAADARGQGVRAERRDLDPQAASLILSIDTTHQQTALANLNELGQFFVEKLTAVSSAPAEGQADKESLQRRLAELDRQLGSLSTQPAEDLTARQDGLLKSWREQLAERAEVEQHLRKIRPALSASPPDPARITIEPAKLAAAQSADSKLQADVQVLADKQQDLRVLLRKALEPGDGVFKRMDTAITSAAKDIKESAADISDSEVTEATQSIQKALAEWTKNLSDVQEAWQAAVKATQAESFDASAVHARLETALRSFTDRTQVGRDAIEKGVESIGQGGEEPTKRIVLRNSVSKQLESALAAQENAVKVVRELAIADNAELAGLIQSIAGLSAQVKEQKDRVTLALRGEALQTARQSYESDLSRARAEQERWLKQASDLDEALLEHNRKVLSLLPQLDEARSNTARRADLYRERGQVLTQLSDLSRKQAEELASRKPPFEARYIPAQAALLPVSPRQHLTQAILLGSLPLTAAGLVLAAIWAATLYGRTRRLGEKYEELLTRQVA